MPSRRSGFTFIEVSVVLVILVLASVIVAPRLASMLDSQRVESFRLDSERIFRSARSLALQTRQDMEVRWDNGLVVTPVADTGDEEDEEEEDQEQASRDSAVAPEGLIEFGRGVQNGEEQAEEDWAIRFSASGTSDAGGLEFTSLGRTFFVSVDSQARIESGSGDLPDQGQAEWDAGDLEQRIDAGQN